MPKTNKNYQERFIQKLKNDGRFNEHKEKRRGINKKYQDKLKLILEEMHPDSSSALREIRHVKQQNAYKKRKTIKITENLNFIQRGNPYVNPQIMGKH